MVSVVAPIIQHHIEHSSDRTRASVRSFFQYFRTFYRLARWRFLLVPVAMVFSGIFESIGIILFFPLLERFQVGVASANMHPLLGRIDEMLRTIGIRSIGAILTFIASVFVVKFVIVFLQRVLIQRIRVDLYRHVANEIILGWSEADYARFYLRTTTGQASSILTNELWTFLAAFAMYAETLVNLVYLVVYFGALLFLDLNVTILALSAGGGVLLLFTRFIGLTKRYSIA
ncbi:ABC transporter ATP-binding protein, partial [Candidatus Uhrbacteria bacterium]|nr:ABC transporter ATP-binding protein [Candidatus Uhrbacteria bacterium]